MCLLNEQYCSNIVKLAIMKLMGKVFISLLLGEDPCHEISRKEAIERFKHSQKLNCSSISSSRVFKSPPSRQHVARANFPQNSLNIIQVVQKHSREHSLIDFSPNVGTTLSSCIGPLWELWKNCREGLAGVATSARNIVENGKEYDFQYSLQVTLIFSVKRQCHCQLARKLEILLPFFSNLQTTAHQLSRR